MTPCLHSDDARFRFATVSMKWRPHFDDGIPHFPAVKPDGISCVWLPDREAGSGRQSATRFPATSIVRVRHARLRNLTVRVPRLGFLRLLAATPQIRPHQVNFRTPWRSGSHPLRNRRLCEKPPHRPDIQVCGALSGRFPLPAKVRNPSPGPEV